MPATGVAGEVVNRDRKATHVVAVLRYPNGNQVPGSRAEGVLTPSGSLETPTVQTKRPVSLCAGVDDQPKVCTAPARITDVVPLTPSQPSQKSPAERGYAPDGRRCGFDRNGYIRIYVPGSGCQPDPASSRQLIPHRRDWMRASEHVEVHAVETLTGEQVADRVVADVEVLRVRGDLGDQGGRCPH
jgi:hypothetical protein